jgi:hypothetical protein
MTQQLQLSWMEARRAKLPKTRNERVLERMKSRSNVARLEQDGS